MGVGGGQPVQDAAPGGEGVDGAAFEAAGGAFQALAGGLLQGFGLGFQPFEEALAQRHQRDAQALQGAGEQFRRRQDVGVDRVEVDLEGHAAFQLRLRGAGAGLDAERAQEGFRRVVVGFQFRVEAGGEHRRRQRLGGEEGGFQFRHHAFVGGHDVFHGAAMPARPRAGALGAEQPAAQFGHRGAGEFDREGAVGGVENMVAFVEHVAGGHVVVVEPAPDGLRHDQRVVGDHEIGLARVADDVLDDAAA